MIISGRSGKAKCTCMVPGCSDKEHYICTNVDCESRLCMKCFNSLNGALTTVCPSKLQSEATQDTGTGDESSADNNDDILDSEEEYDSSEDDDFTYHSSDDDDSVESVTHLTFRDQVQDSAAGQFDAYSGDPLDEFLVDSGVILPDEDDNTREFDGEDDPASQRPGLFSTNAGVLPQTVLQRQSKWATSVPGHVLFNQVGSCLQRHNHRMTGKYFHSSFIQRMVSTVDGSSFPLLYLLATCFPRHWYASSTKDSAAILGAPPLSTYR